MSYAYTFFSEQPYIDISYLDEALAAPEEQISIAQGHLNYLTPDDTPNSQIIGNYTILRVNSPLVGEEHVHWIYIQASTIEQIIEFVQTMKMLHSACETTQSLIWNTAQLLA